MKHTILFVSDFIDIFFLIYMILYMNIQWRIIERKTNAMQNIGIPIQQGIWAWVKLSKGITSSQQTFEGLCWRGCKNIHILMKLQKYIFV